MAMFAEKRKSQNSGCGDGSGRWLFEEFMFADSVFGRAVVEYGFSSHPIARCDRTLHGPVFEPEIHDDETVVLLEVHNDDGNVIATKDTLPLTEWLKLNAMVLEAFRADESAVIEYEGSLL